MKLLIKNLDNISTAIVQVDGHAEEVLPPGESMTIFVDDDSECVISKEN
ncbi:MAG: hypothetical protein ACXWAT_06760 [Methylobacter sp.]